MDIISVAAARQNFASLMRQAAVAPVFVARHGEPEIVLISPKMFAELVEAKEELEDIEAFDLAMAEPSDSIPWNQVRADLGWV